MNVLVWWLLISVCTATFIFVILFYASVAAFIIKKILWFPCLLVSFGGLVGTWAPSDINNSLTSGLEVLKKVAAISSGNTKSCESEYILNRNRV